MPILPITNSQSKLQKPNHNTNYNPLLITRPMARDTVSFKGPQIKIIEGTIPLFHKSFLRLPKLMDNFVAYVVRRPMESFQVAKMKELSPAEYANILKSDKPHGPVLFMADRRFWLSPWIEWRKPRGESNPLGFFADETGKNILPKVFDGTNLVEAVKNFKWLRGKQPARASLAYADNGALIYAGFHAPSKEINAGFKNGKLTHIDILSASQRTFSVALFDEKGNLLKMQQYRYDKDRHGDLAQAIYNYSPTSEDRDRLQYFDTWDRLDETLHMDISGS